MTGQRPPGFAERVAAAPLYRNLTSWWSVGGLLAIASMWRYHLPIVPGLVLVFGGFYWYYRWPWMRARRDSIRTRAFVRWGIKVFGFSRIRAQHVWVGMLIGLVMSPCAGYVDWLVNLFVSFGPQTPTVAIEQGRWPSIGAVAQTVVYAPLVEETVFRGVAQGAWQRAFTPWPWLAIPCTALWFATIHPYAAPALVSVVVVGGGFLGCCRYFTGSIWTGVIAHATYNGLWILQTVWGLSWPTP